MIFAYDTKTSHKIISVVAFIALTTVSQDMAFLLFFECQTSVLQQAELFPRHQFARFFGVCTHVRDVRRRQLLTGVVDMQTLKSTQAMADAMKGATKVCQFHNSNY